MTAPLRARGASPAIGVAGIARSTPTAAAFALALAACAPAAPASGPATQVRSAVLPGSPGTAAPAPVAAAAPPVFVEDDYARALAEARSSGRPLFIDAWAPWCHTCLSMRAYVFGDPALRRHAQAFVWLAMDTEKPTGAAFLARYPMSSWPTLWVVDPRREAPVLKWVGAATAPELAVLLDDAHAAATGGAPESGAAAGALLRGKQATAAGDDARAIAEYRAALAAAPAAWPRRPQAAEALAFALQRAGDSTACVAHARAELPALPPGTSRANVALAGLGCARASKAKADVLALADEVDSIARDARAPLLADDRSSLFEELVDARKELRDTAGATAAARAWSTFVDGEAARAASKEARVVFDAHRLLAYTALGEAEKAIPFLTASERDFPADYNPPARLARVYLELGRHDEALAAVDRALAKVYGPRELRLHGLRADVLLAHGDVDGARAALKRGIARAAAMPALPGAYAGVKDDFAKRLAALEKALDR